MMASAFYHTKKTGKIKIVAKKITLCSLYVPYNTREIELRHAYKSKYNLKRGNQIVLLVITDGEKWHYHVVKKKCLHCLEE